MKKSRFTEEQIIKALKRHESGEKIPDLCRELGISEQVVKFPGLSLLAAKTIGMS